MPAALPRDESSLLRVMSDRSTEPISALAWELGISKARTLEILAGFKTVGWFSDTGHNLIDGSLTMAGDSRAKEPDVAGWPLLLDKEMRDGLYALLDNVLTIESLEPLRSEWMKTLRTNLFHRDYPVDGRRAEVEAALEFGGNDGGGD